MTRFLYFIPILICFSFSDPYTIKRISDVNFRYEFYTTDKKITPKSDKTYFWFKGGLIHSAQAGIAGSLLNEKYTKMYHSNQLAEQGEFKNGLKVKLWKTWHPNGTVATTQYWNNGRKTGLFYHYDQNGKLLEKGNYKSDQKHGQWIDFTKGDTLQFNRGAVVPKTPKVSKEETERLKKEKQKLKDARKQEKNKEQPNTKTARETDASAGAKNAPQPVKAAKKEGGFLKRLFAKKTTKTAKDGPGA